MLEEIYKLKRLTSTRIAKALNENVRNVVSLFKMYKKAGIRIKPDIDIKSLGVKHQIVIVDRYVPNAALITASPHVFRFIRSITYVLPRSTMIAFETPECENVDYDYYCIESTIRSRPDPVTLFKVADGKYDEIFINSLPKPIPIPLARRGRFDWYDLEILRVVSMEPWIKMRNLAKRLKIKERNLIKHLPHAENFITGYRVSKIERLREESAISYFISMEFDKPRYLCSRFVRHPFVISCGECSGKRAVVYAASPANVSPLFVYFVRRLADELGARVERIYSGCHKCLLATTIGSRSTGEFVPREGWQAPDIEGEIRELIKNGLLVPA